MNMQRRTFLNTGRIIPLAVRGRRVYRTVEQGVFRVRQCIAYKPWKDWRDVTTNSTRIVAAGIPAVNPYNAHSWHMQISAQAVDLYALRRWLGIMAVAVAIHNLEEYFGFESYAYRRKLHVTRTQLQIALSLATILPLVLILRALQSPKQSQRMVLGFLVPAIFAANAVSHVAQTLAFRDYSPGTATAVGLNLPFALVLYQQALRAGYLTPQQARQTLLWGTLTMPPCAILLQSIGWIGARLLAHKRS